MLKRFFYLREEIENFMKKKGEPVLEFQSSEWMQKLAIMVDIIVDLTFRITTCRSLLAIAFRT